MTKPGQSQHGRVNRPSATARSDLPAIRSAVQPAVRRPRPARAVHRLGGPDRAHDRPRHHVRAGRQHLVQRERLPGVDVPTLRELGYDVVFANWRGVSVHKSLDDKSATALADLFAKLVKSAHWKKILDSRGWLDLYLAEAPYQAFIADETRQAKEILTELGLATQ